MKYRYRPVYEDPRPSPWLETNSIATIALKGVVRIDVEPVPEQCTARTPVEFDGATLRCDSPDESICRTIKKHATSAHGSRITWVYVP